MNVFESSPLWTEAKSYITVPERENRSLIHELIYEVKRFGYSSDIEAKMQRVLKSTSCDAIICGCTEFHLLYVRSNEMDQSISIDPLVTIADAINAASLRRHETRAFAEELS